MQFAYYNVYKQIYKYKRKKKYSPGIRWEERRSGLGPVTDGEDAEENGEYMGGGSPSGVSSLTYLFSSPSLRSYTGKMSPLAVWRTSETKSSAVGKQLCSQELCLPLRQGGEGR